MKNKKIKSKQKFNKTAKMHSKIVNNCANYANFIQIYQNFHDWLAGIQEDDPLPFETKNIYFIVEFTQNSIMVSYSADDKNLELFDYGSYFPLEAQYFFSAEIINLSYELFVKKSISKKDVFDMLKSLVLRAKKELNFLQNKHIFIGERFDKIFV